MKKILILVCVLSVLATACHRKTAPSSSGNGKLVTETGYASYYSDNLVGHSTANGETYSATKLTAAHRTLPFGTTVTITNLANGKSVTVRVNDRGPFVSGRIIDLSKAAARQIDMIGPGVVKVRIQYRR